MRVDVIRMGACRHVAAHAFEMFELEQHFRRLFGRKKAGHLILPLTLSGYAQSNMAAVNADMLMDVGRRVIIEPEHYHHANISITVLKGIASIVGRRATDLEALGPA